MQDFNMTMEESLSTADDRQAFRERVWNLVTDLFKRLVVFVSFGPGILGVLWLLGRIIKR